MQPVPRRVLKSYNIRFQLEALMRAANGAPLLTDAIDVHAHAAPGTENPLDMAKRASQANMGAVVFKNLPQDKPYHVTAQEVQEAVNRWAEKEGVRPVTCYHGVQTDYGQGGLDFEKIRERVDNGGNIIWFPVISSAHNVYRVGSPPRAVKGEFDTPVVGPLPWDEALKAGQYLLGDDGNLKPVVKDILRLAADKRVGVSFAHSSKPEMEALAEECGKLGYRQAFIDHPYGPQVGLEFDELKPFADAGLIFNFTYDEISPLLGVDPQDMMGTVNALGAEHFSLSSDGGNPLLPGAVESLNTLVRYGRAYGLTDEELRLVTVENPKRILGLN
jgi:Family of unknown function (DUF6282)